MTDNDMPILVSNPVIRLGLKDCPKSVPMICLDGNQAVKNHGQTLQRLKERGGVSPSEALALIHHRKWSPILHQQAVDDLNVSIKRIMG